MRLGDKGEDGCMELVTKGEQNRGAVYANKEKNNFTCLHDQW